MEREENIKQSLIKKFNFADDKIRITRERRISADVDQKIFWQVLDYLIKDLHFDDLCTITGLDEGENLSAVYHLDEKRGIVLNLKTSVPKNNPVIKTITSIFPSADAYERELIDLLGFKVEGLAPGNRYPLTDDWPKGQYPLRKDWTVDQLK